MVGPEAGWDDGWDTVWDAVGAGAGAGGGGPTVTGTDWITADWRTDWMTNGLALSCLGGGRDKWSMTSDMAWEA